MNRHRIVCFGDSITSGDHYGADEGWVSRLRDRYQSAGIEVINKGVPGDFTQRALCRFATDVVSHLPALLLIQFGFNDSAVASWTSVPTVSLSEFERNIREFVICALQHDSVPVLIANHQPDMPDTRYGNGKNYNENTAPYTDKIREIATALHVPLIDMPQLFTTYSISSTEYIGPDGHHLSSLGNELYAALVAEQLAAFGVFDGTPHLHVSSLLLRRSDAPHVEDSLREAFAMVERGEANGGMRLLKNALILKPDRIDLFTILIRLAVSTRDLGTLRWLAQLACGRDDLDDRILVDLAEGILPFENAVDSRIILELLIQRNPTNISIHHELAKTYAKLSHRKRALAVAHAATLLEEQKFESLSLYCWLLIEAEMYVEAAQTLEAMRLLRPEAALVQTLQEEVSRKTTAENTSAKNFRLFNKFQNVTPFPPDLTQVANENITQARQAIAQNNLQAADTFIRTAIRADPDRTAVYQLAVPLAELQRDSSLIEWACRIACTHKTENEEVLTFLARALLRFGKHQQAKRALDQAFLLRPSQGANSVQKLP